MRRYFLIIAATLCLLTTQGCGNLSPRQDPEINKNQGQIGEVENLANSNKADLGNLQSQAEIQNSKLDKIQQGLTNFQSANENSGIQILSGQGGILISLVAVIIVCVIAVHYRGQAQQQGKVANMLAARIVECDDEELENDVFQAAMYTDVETNVLQLMKKHKEA